MKISELKPLEKNPFKAKNDEQIEKIGKSISEFERMMSIRPIIIDEGNTVLGGNKRYFALKKLGYKEIPDTWVKREEGLTEEEKREFIVKDNSHWGSEWDYEMLQDWDVDLEEWGVDLPEDEMIEALQKTETIHFEKSLQVLPKKEYILIMADEDSEEWDELKQIFKCNLVRQGGCTIGSASDKATTGLERVFDLKTFKERVLNELHYSNTE